jgi:hypothetical protein
MSVAGSPRPATDGPADGQWTVVTGTRGPTLGNESCESCEAARASSDHVERGRLRQRVVWPWLDQGDPVVVLDSNSLDLAGHRRGRGHCTRRSIETLYTRLWAEEATGR